MSCCTCNSTPCCCAGQLAPAACCTPTTESVEYTFENGNEIGIGVFDNDTDNLVQFRGIASDTLALTVTLDAANKAIIISFDDELLIDDIPTFTETVRGIGEAATQAETNAGAADDKIVTPLKLSTMQATETQIGVLRIATQAEVTTGTNDTEAITPLKLTTFAGTQFTTRVFADAVARAAAVPTFDGQIGVQLDTNALIVANGTIAGSFSPNLVSSGTLTVTGQAFFADGIAGAPSISFTTDTDTGFYRIAANAIAVVSGGTAVWTFASGGTITINPIAAADGGSGAPTYSFSNSQTTGMYSPGPDEIGFVCGGTDSMALSATSMSLAAGVSLFVDKTITGGTGAQVINKMAGSVNFAAAATTLVVTNNLVTVNSLVFAQVATDDATMKTVSVTQTAGAFTITANAAATGTTRVNFLVIN